MLTEQELDNIEHGRELQVKAQSFNHSRLLIDDLLGAELISGNFLGQVFQPQGVDLLVLGGDEHARDPDQVDALVGLGGGLPLQVQVHQNHTLEERLL